MHENRETSEMPEEKLVLRPAGAERAARQLWSG
jgi:hypothetical protein